VDFRQKTRQIDSPRDFRRSRSKVDEKNKTGGSFHLFLHPYFNIESGEVFLLYSIKELKKPNT
jgi:hypothetical protein